jgi:hypothetical protein
MHTKRKSLNLHLQIKITDYFPYLSKSKTKFLKIGIRASITQYYEFKSNGHAIQIFEKCSSYLDFSPSKIHNQDQNNWRKLGFCYQSNWVKKF